MTEIWSGVWQGRYSTEYTGYISELRKLMPTFTISDFHIGKGVNKYLNLIAREPLDEADLGNEVDTMNSFRIPIAAVSNDYQRSLYRGRRQGYKLVQHHEMLDSVLGKLKVFSHRREQDNIFEDSRFRAIPLTDPASLDAKLKISEYGARVRIEFLVPNYEFYHDDGKPSILKVICLNSVDRSIALRISLSLEREFSDGIFIAGFHRTHDQELEDWAVEKFFNDEFHRFSNGEWIKQTIPEERVEDLLGKYFTDLDIQKIRDLYAKLIAALDEAESRLLLMASEVNYLLFRQALSALVHEQETLHLQDQKMGKILDMLAETLKEET